MQRKIRIIAGLSLFSASPPLVAQSASEVDDAIEDAIQAVVDGAEGRAGEIGPPPAIMITSEETGRAWGSARPLNYTSWRIIAADYPAELWQEGPEGETSYQLVVDEEGRPSACEITESSGNAILDQLTCDIIMERGMFNPAQDEEGNPTAGDYSGFHFWRKRGPDFGETSSVRISFTVDERGNITDCRTPEITGQPSEQWRQALEREPCPRSNPVNAGPYRDTEGIPVSRRVSVTIQGFVEDPEEYGS